MYDGRKIHLYIDGILDEFKEASGLVNTNDFHILIGENAEEKGRFWKGLIDDVRIYSYALSPEEVKMLYEDKEPPREKISE